MQLPAEWECEDCGALYTDTSTLETGPYGYACPACDGIWVTGVRVEGGG